MVRTTKMLLDDTFPFTFNYDISYLIDQIRIFLAYKAILDSKRNLPLKVKLNLFNSFVESSPKIQTYYG